MIRIFLVLFALLFHSNCSAAVEEGAKFIKKFNSWKVFVKRIDENRSHCALIANPISTAGFYSFRDIPYAGFVSSKGNNFSFSIYAGFVINKDKPIQVFIDDNLFYLKFYRDFFAYTYDANDDVKLINTILINQGIMRIRVESKEKEIANDYYELRGLESAFAFLKENYNCS